MGVCRTASTRWASVAASFPTAPREWIGESRYPYVTWGISTLDQVAPNNAYVIYGSTPISQVRLGRKPACVGVKGVDLDPVFASRHMPAGPPFDTTIFTEPTIDHLDLAPSYPPYYDNLLNTYAGATRSSTTRSSPIAPPLGSVRIARMRRTASVSNPCSARSPGTTGSATAIC